MEWQLEVIMKLIILINKSPHNCLCAVSCALWRGRGAQRTRGSGGLPLRPVPLRILSGAECGLCRLHLKCLLSALRQGMSQRGREGPGASWAPVNVGGRGLLAPWHVGSQLLPSTLKTQPSEHWEGYQDRVEVVWAFTRKTANSSGRSPPKVHF